ncbi:MAG: YcaQ family DNA glycosylase [Marinosulfonomonas sp.]|nr:YcaQ family DNA glycosylase [Marinosulfonomonas sp.]
MRHVLKINNRTARRLWLQSQGLALAPTGPPDVPAIVRQLGFVQLDTIRNVARAHDHILWSRNQNYREDMLNDALTGRQVFEHFTHDASVLPMEFYPMWRRQFARKGEYAASSSYYHTGMSGRDVALIKARIRLEGPLSTHAFDTKVKGEKGMWKRPPHKVELDKMWYAGELATSHRKNFKKFYDLAERVIPQEVRDVAHPDDVQIDWLCHGALDRLGFGTLGEVQRFWAAVGAVEVKAWAAKARLVPVEVQSGDGSWAEGFAPADIEARLEQVCAPTSRLRIVNPFDPVVRDRVRLAMLFGFDYRIEIFVPAAKRKWGYYVYPLLEGDRFVGRIDMKADRAAGVLVVKQVWLERGVGWTGARVRKLEAELDRMARFVGVSGMRWECALG